LIRLPSSSSFCCENVEGAAQDQDQWAVFEQNCSGSGFGYGSGSGFRSGSGAGSGWYSYTEQCEMRCNRNWYQDRNVCEWADRQTG
jgi:hypothetical protein